MIKISIPWKFIKFGHHKLACQKMSTEQFKRSAVILREIFECCVNSVKPKYLFNSEFVQYDKSDKGDELFKISDLRHQLEIDLARKRVTVIGFGKGVLGMAVQLERILGPSRIDSGILTIPVGQQDTFKSNPDMKLSVKSSIEVYEGSENNLPDQAAFDIARRIQKKVKRLDNEDILIVLISGGGSALLPFPKFPIKLSEKKDLIKKLASKGASIEELNTVRIAISEVKGGKLLKSAQNCCKLINIIISDIVRDPLNLIASGPTVMSDCSADYGKLSKEILTKYRILNEMPASILSVFELPSEPFSSNNHSSFLIGTNQVAIEAGLNIATKHNLCPIFLSRQIEGDVNEIADGFIELAILVQKFRTKEITSDVFDEKMKILNSILKFNENFENSLKQNINQHLCLISGGEPTVKLTGNGIGGRNQELALRFLIKSSKYSALLQSVRFLSAGTDGIDGPTDAAGAIANPELFFLHGNYKESLHYLNNNDSYNFFKNFNNGSEHIIVGHTGTNVMDIQILIIPPVLY